MPTTEPRRERKKKGANWNGLQGSNQVAGAEPGTSRGYPPKSSISKAIRRVCQGVDKKGTSKERVPDERVSKQKGTSKERVPDERVLRRRESRKKGCQIKEL